MNNPIPATRHPDVLYGPHQPELLRNEILADLLEASARRAPHQWAFVSGARRLSYRELDEQASLAASRLIDSGIGPGDIVGLWMPRGIELLIMQAAIAKTGAAWLPVDEDTPAERLLVCMLDAGSPALVTSEQMRERAGSGLGCDSQAIHMAEDLLLPAADGYVLKRRGVVPGSAPAYVIYTSGSTGKPKGILIDQRSICHFLRSENEVLGVRADDCVYQGFSVAFDMSFEEIWISYLAGATLWLGPKETAGDPEALPRLLAENGVTVLHAVPTLLSLFADDVPGLRIINLGGEMCPEAVVERFSKPGRIMFNTYGPTEATVSASLARMEPGRSITIGEPLPNYGLLVISTETDKGLRILPRGETGELCITGPGLSAGYLGRPDLTAEKFLPNPWASGSHDDRLYRTGDLARIEPDGQVVCLGRTDDQVKIRGFRVELGEIEAVLAQQEGVGTTAVLLRKDEGIDHLVAYLVPAQGATGEQLASATLRKALSGRLPPYMVPSQFEVLAVMPRLTSGKIDRKALKAMALSTPLPGDPAGSDTPETPGEQALFAALAQLFPGQAIRREQDFFSDLGGHSFFAARLATALRRDPRFAHLTVRDIYEQRRIGAIASSLDQGAGTAAEEPDWAPPPAARRWLCGLAQLATVPVLVTLRMAQWLAPFFTYHYMTGDAGDRIPRAIAAAIGVFLLATIMEFAFAIGGKWLVAGRLKPGSYPLWGRTYFRWWLGDRLIEAAPTYLLAGSSLYTWWLRLLGAKIGRDAVIGSMMVRVPELLHVGDNVSIGNAVNVENARVERGRLLLGTVVLEDDAFVSSYALLEGNTRVERRGHLEGQSALQDGAVVPANRVWNGSPARDAGAFDPSALPPRQHTSRLRLAGEALFFIFGILLVATLFFMPVFPSFVLIDWFDERGTLAWLPANSIQAQLVRYFVLALPASAVLILMTVLVSAAIRWGFLPRIQPGRFAVHSNAYCKKWLVSHIQESSLNVLHGIYATVYAPFWYRLLGAKVGRDAEISTALGVVPDMLTLGDETFIADAVMLGDEHIDGGWMTMEPTVVSNRSFVGNGSYIPDGTILPEGVLVGVHTHAPANERMKDGDTWLGSPPIHLPAREQVSGYPEHLTYRPSPLRRLGRALVEAFRIVAPHALVIAVGYTVVLDLMPVAGAGHWAEVISYLALIGLAYGIGNYLFVLAFKWVLVGRYQKRAEPMWTPFVWVSEGVTNMYEGIAVPNFMRYLRGTPWLPIAFRLLGCRIGKGVYLDTTDITEFDCVHIGDHSELNALSCPQTHLFEDRVMKIDRVDIGSKVYVGPRSAVLYSARVGDNARLGPLTLVMKGEHIPAASSWIGLPAAPLRAAQ
ncbi:Pls/PosA family non-ribosomal peptide synthetase [Massilia litorea]|uniref:Amino acid adenylation domain-containing protein n=1 Tax=Massilia litorea TaxID=2769491 RepID=A0A7L9TY45_9BURK|nr:Pls/PosA family non-ribosomal peptide synthetase [Massilia litorea]QOL47721.1 amino acid adenylation domain-containing protein [Massilia litorea]